MTHHFKHVIRLEAVRKLLSELRNRRQVTRLRASLLRIARHASLPRTAKHRFVVQRVVRRDLECCKMETAIQHFFRRRQKEFLATEPQRSVIRFEKRRSFNQKRDCRNGSKDRDQMDGIEVVLHRQEQIRRQNVQTDRLELTGASHAHLNEAIAVLRREKHRVVETLGGVEQMEVRRCGVHIDPRALAPHLARLRHVLQRVVEHRHRGIRTEHPTPHLASLCSSLVHDVDVAGPQAARADVLLQRVDVQPQRLRVLLLQHELLDPLEQELPLGREERDAVVEQADAGREVQRAVLQLAVLQNHCVARFDGRETEGALEKLAAELAIAEEAGVATDGHVHFPEKIGRAGLHAEGHVAIHAMGDVELRFDELFEACGLGVRERERKQTLSKVNWRRNMQVRYQYSTRRRNTFQRMSTVRLSRASCAFFSMDSTEMSSIMDSLFHCSWRRCSVRLKQKNQSGPYLGKSTSALSIICMSVFIDPLRCSPSIISR